MIIEVNEFELDRVVPLYRALHYFHVDEMPWRYHLHGKDEGFHQDLKDRAQTGSWVYAIDAGWGLAGYVMATPRVYAENHIDQAQRHLQIEHLYVAQTHRRQGQARALIDTALKRARHEGFTRWGVGYNAFNKAAAAFYRSCGAEDHGAYATAFLTG